MRFSATNPRAPESMCFCGVAWGGGGGGGGEGREGRRQIAVMEDIVQPV